MEERGVGGGKTGQQGVGKKQGVAVAYSQKFVWGGAGSLNAWFMHLVEKQMSPCLGKAEGPGEERKS